ncbi:MULTISPECIES: M1 family metallopeptidase [Mumia]|uniref:M1 family metallopeptidase n=1 Tax=Mumia TaxID=1546255 RepID=UPI0014218F92|nr:MULTISPECIES: M1 family metallopeptidase [unclassified Mumia]QMW65506.1 M1 family metallopeptidase [Mumia sp. ZJ1417]
MRPFLAMVTAVLVAATVAVAPTASAADSTVGGPGAGDPYFPRHGNGGYDVRHYRINAAYDAPRARLKGTTRIRAVAFKRLTRFNLDLLLDASSVRVDGRKARLTQRGRELVVTPARAIRKGARFVVTVRYAGRPASVREKGVTPFLTTKSGAVAVGQPQVAPWWFASNDHPSDKATFDIRLRAPRGQQALSVGRLASHRAVAGGNQWRWVMRKPMATYLAFAAWGRFRIDRGKVNGVRYLYAYDKAMSPALRRRAIRSLRATPQVTAFLSRHLGPYPYADLGGVVTSAPLEFALETQARPVYDSTFFRRASSLDARRNTSVVAHEIAHQWFGNSVSLRRWRDIWLNEGLATYMEWMWDESRGLDDVETVFDSWYSVKGAWFWRLPIGKPGRNHIFDYEVYVRGAMTAHALRGEIGDAAFFSLLRRWVSERKDGHGTTAQFVALAEKVSGQQLDTLFDAWLYSGKRPAL